MSTLKLFDEKSMAIRVTLFLYKNPRSTITQIVKNLGGQVAVYSSLEMLDTIGCSVKEKNNVFPYNPVYRLTEKGETIAKLFCEVQQVLDS